MSDDTSAVAPPPQAKTNTLAILSLVFAFLVPLVGAILGHVALSQITRRGEQGRGLALAGIIVGWVLALAWLFVIVPIALIFFGLASFT
jgi:hypothetical protein